MRDRTLIVANWKMDFTVQEASLFVHKLDKKIKNHRNVEVVLAPSILALQTLNLQIDHRKFRLAVQNLYWRDEGAYTGEISAHQLHGLVRYAIIGHSERRHLFGDRPKEVRAKVQAAVRNEIIPILCVGESASEKASGETMDVLRDQVTGGLANLTAEEVENIVIAYEPVWAISSGKDFATHAAASTKDATAAAKAIRSYVAHMFGKKVAQSIRILYGASTNTGNAGDFLSSSQIDGLLVGGASLNLEQFAGIVEAAHKRDKA